MPGLVLCTPPSSHALTPEYFLEDLTVLPPFFVHQSGQHQVCHGKRSSIAKGPDVSVGGCAWSKWRKVLELMSLEQVRRPFKTGITCTGGHSEVLKEVVWLAVAGPIAQNRRAVCALQRPELTL